MKNKVLALVLVVILCFSSMGAAVVDDVEVETLTPRNIVVAAFSANVQKSAFDIKLIIDATLSSADYTSVVETTFQQSSNQTSWTNVSTKTETEEGRYVYLTSTIAGTSGTYYRANVSISVYDLNGNFIEKLTIQTNVVQF